VPQFLGEDERLMACRELAMKMLTTGSLELTGTQVEHAVKQARLPTIRDAEPDDRQGALERAVTDVRVCSFLSSTHDGSLRFGHKSYFEFFVAQQLVLSAQYASDSFSQFARKRLSKEIIYFLGSFARDLEFFGQTTIKVLRNTIAADSATRELAVRI